MERRLDKQNFILQTAHVEIQRRRAESFPLHAHDYFELEMVLDGEGEQWLNGKHYTLSRGSVYLLTPADFHEVKTKRAMLVWNISFDETILTGQPRCVCTNVDENMLERLDAAAALLRREVKTDGYVQPLMEYVLSSVLRSDVSEETLTHIDRAIQYIETHFRENPSLSDVAQKVCLCPVYFGTLFKKQTGQTYVEFLNAKKIECAKMLLKNGMSVTDACFASGFGSLSGFLYTFKKNVGTPPKYYLKDK